CALAFASMLFSTLLRPPRITLFPYTTLFRSSLSRSCLVALLERLNFGTMLSQGLEAAHLVFNPSEALTHIIDVATDPWMNCQGVLRQLSCQVGTGLIQSSIGPVTTDGGHELGAGPLKIVGHDMDGVVFAPTRRTHIDATS